MQTITINKTKYRVPSGWDEISWAKFYQYSKLNAKEFESDYLYAIEFAAFFGVPEVQTLKATGDEIATLFKAINVFRAYEFAQLPQTSFNYEGRQFVFNLSTFGQWVRLDEIRLAHKLKKDKGEDFDIVPFQLATCFVEANPKQAPVLERIYKAVINRNVMEELDGFDGKREIINSLDAVTVQNLCFFLSKMSENSSLDTKVAYLQSLSILKMEMLKIQISKTNTRKSLANYLRFGVYRFTIFMIGVRMRYWIFMRGKLKK